ncbi:MAG: hydrogenase maturation nickel metallochaperone HypA [Oscillospiraceae bacterium]|nr:hydrogenase maturation nickel metallochaperone HypA [Oscillospiraceae bacterium]
MHELAITEGIMEAAVPEAKRHGAKKILEIRLKIGELSGVLPECIQEYFNIVSRGTIAEGARLAVEKIPVTIECRDCGYDGEIPKRKIHCPSCGSSEIKIKSGREYFVDSLEVE